MDIRMSNFIIILINLLINNKLIVSKNYKENISYVMEI